MVTDSSIIELVESGFLKDAATQIDARSSLTNSLRVLRARLELEIGFPDRAKSASEALLAERLTNAERSTCWEVIARVNFRAGNSDEGLTSAHRAFQFAADCPDPRVEARLIANHCDTLLHWIGIDA